MNNLHLIAGAVHEAAKAGGLQQDHAETLFHRLSGYLDDVPGEIVVVFEEIVQRILDARLPQATAATSLKAESLAIKSRLEALHEKLVEGSVAREFSLRALCALGGALSHIPDDQ